MLRDGNVVGKALKTDMTIERMISLMVGRQIDQLFPAREHKAPGKTILQVSGITQPGTVKDILVKEGDTVGEGTVLARLDALDADLLLEVHRERRFHRLQHARRAGFLALFDVRDEVLVQRAHVIDGAAARDARRQVA